MAAPSLLQRVVEGVFTYPPVFNAAAKAARKKIMERGIEMGTWAEIDVDVDFWGKEIALATKSDVSTPDYYRAPFHAYPQGNLSLDAALEVTNAARSVHATVFNVGESEALDPNGDERLRSSFSAKVKELFLQTGIELGDSPRILDIGAATGLSSLALLKAFPGASVRGVDLSPYFVAVGLYLNRELMESEPGRLTLEHGAAEKLDMVDDESLDMASMCLVCHELPQDATIRIFREAHRKLKPGGCLCVMEMDPKAPAFQRILSAAVPYVVFKSTEPYLLDYVAFDMEGAMHDVGFDCVVSANNSPRHKTVVAVKSR